MQCYETRGFVTLLIQIGIIHVLWSKGCQIHYLLVIMKCYLYRLNSYNCTGTLENDGATNGGTGK